MRADGERGAVDVQCQGRADVDRVDTQDLSLAELEGVVDDELSQSFDAEVGHAGLIPDGASARTASSTRPGPNRTGSSATSPVSSRAFSITCRAVSSSSLR